MNVKRSHSIVGMAAMLLAVALPMVTSLFPESASAATYCQCVGYVKNRIGVTRPVGHAKDMVYSLPQLGYKRIASPTPGAIAVMQRSFPGADKTYGHVGFIESIDSRGRIQLRGANHGGSRFKEAGCNNVAIVRFGTSVYGRNDVSYWIKAGSTQQPPAPTSSDSIRRVNFSGKAAPAGVRMRSAPSLSGSIVGKLSPHQRVNFDAWTYGDTVNDIWLNKPDARWFRITGTNNWVASGVIYGNPPASRPMP